MAIRVKLLLVFLFISLQNDTCAEVNHAFFEKADYFFNTYVSEGHVKYDAIKKEPGLLNEIVKIIENISLEGEADLFKKAFYLNAYNILTIQQVVERYPVAGPMQVSGFFSGINHTVAGRRVTLDQLEKDLLYKQFADARLHLALVCAAKGCPPLAGFAFVPEKLDQQLDEISELALNDDAFIRLDTKKERVYLPQIFEWYKQDFLQYAGSLLAFINQYRSRKVPDNYKIRMYDYDWSLNEVDYSSEK